MSRKHMWCSLFWDWSYRNPKGNKRIVKLQKAMNEVEMFLCQKSIKKENTKKS